MLDENLKNRILRLIRAEVVPAVGCTEPVAVALAVARATELAGADRHCLDKIECRLSGNIIKNAMGVGIPGTGMTGLPIAVALGALQGRSERGLEVLADVSDDDVRRGRETIDRGIISIVLADDADDVLYIDVTVTAAGRSGRAIISGGHTRFVYEAGNGKTVLDIRGKRGDGANDSITVPELDMATVWNFAMTVPPDELDFILETRRLNKLAAERALMAEYGHRVGRTLHSERQRSIMGDSIFSRILSYTAAACDARMGGAPVAVMSNSGSGNQGIAATMPVVIYAEEVYADHEQTVRALILSHLTSIYIKQSLGRLSALCGCVVASTGSSCGITYLMGGTYEQVSYSVKNMIANLAGMVCDGAKPSCALKVTSGVSTAVLSAMLAIQNKHVTSVEGLVEDDVDRTIHNMTRIGAEGMNETDKMVLDIMTHKK